MKDEQENKQQQPQAAKKEDIKTPEPPQRKNPHNKAESNRDDENAPENTAPGKEAGNSGKTGSADRKPGPAGKKEQDPPTTTTNRNSY